MLNCKLDKEIMKIGSKKLDSVKFDFKFDGCFTIYKLKRFQRLLSDNYNFCSLGILEDTVLEQINKNINE
jgi:hypothetical protein